MTVAYLHPRGTRANLDSLASAGQLSVGQLYLLTDEGRIAIATTANNYVTYAKQLEAGGGTWGSITGTLANQTDLNTALSGKEPTIAEGNTTQFWRGDKSWQTLDKTVVGLGNVDNTSDADKPVSVATQTALNLKLDTSHAGAGDVAHALATATVAGFMSSTDKSKLDGVAAGATANSSDATLKDRSNHTGEQAISTITGLQTALDGKASTATFTSTVKGLVPASGGGTTTFLRADGIWAVPPGSGEAGTSGWGPVTAVGTGASQDITLPEVCTTEDVLVFVEGVFQHSGYTVSGTTLTTTQPSGYNIIIVRYGQGQKGDPGDAAGILSMENTWTASQTFNADVTLGGNLLPSQDSVFSIGSATLKWKDIFVSAETIHLGDSTQLSGTSIVIDSGGTGNSLADIPTIQASKIVAQPYTYDVGGGPVTVRPTIEFQVSGQSYPISLNTSTFEFSLDAQGNYGTGSLVAKKITLLNESATVLNLTGNIIQDGNYTNTQADNIFRFDGNTTLGYDALNSLTVKATTTFIAPISLQGAATLGDGNDTIAVNAGSNAFTVSASNIDITANGDVTIAGNLTISGTTTTVNSNEVNIGDAILTLNSDIAAGATPTEDAGIQINRGTLADSSWLWDESEDAWSPMGGDIKGVGVLSANSIAVTSTAVVTNLNADKLDGQDASAFEPAIASGTTAQYLRGDKTWQTLPVPPAQKITMALSIVGKPSDGQKIIPRFEVADAFTLSEASSRGSAGTVATGSAVFVLKKNGTQVGTITWAASQTLAVVDLTAATISFATGDILTLDAPATADATLADISITLAGTYN